MEDGVSETLKDQSMEQAAGGASSEEAERPDANLPPTDTESSSFTLHLHHLFHPHPSPTTALLRSLSCLSRTRFF